MTYSHHILIFGAGKSATVLITHLLSQSKKNKWQITVVDADIELVQSKTKSHPDAIALSCNINNAEDRKQLIQRADIVISMLPPSLHYLIAKDCVACCKHLLTASYVDEKIRELEKDIKQSGLLFLFEMGLDPGIDHMSAMQLINVIHEQGGIINNFKSHCGGLVAPESDDNPWHYKITWNPANIVNAGKTGAAFKHNGQIKKVSYPDIFKECDKIQIPGLGQYAYYPNRDSISYATLYGLEKVDTFIRTTLRHPDFCKGWYYIAKTGLTDNSISSYLENRTFAEWFTSSLKQFTNAANFSDFITNCVEKKDQELIKKLFLYLGVGNHAIIPRPVSSSSAAILQHLLEAKLKLKEQDQDMIVMLHEINYKLNNLNHTIKSCMVVKGDDGLNTAMAKTVGLPLAIATELILKNKLNITGLHIPVIKEIYEPVLKKLKENNIQFEEV